jgi:hypothetical protein
MKRVIENPQSVIGIQVAEVGSHDWDGCWPVVADGKVVGVISGDQQTLAGSLNHAEVAFDEQADCFTPWVASIDTDNGRVRLAVFGNDQSGYRVIAENGDDLDLPTERTYDAALNNIDQSWGRDGAGVWHLEWIELR